MKENVLDYINVIVREEKGNRVDETSTLRDAALDSFGITMLFIALDERYQYFKKGGYGDNPFKEIHYDTITIKEVIATCLLEVTNT